MSIIKILMERDDLTYAEARDMFDDARSAVADGDDPEEVLMEFLGLEPDYIFEII